MGTVGDSKILDQKCQQIVTAIVLRIPQRKVLAGLDPCVI